MERTNPLEMKTEWSGYLNNFPATVLLRVIQEWDGDWVWKAELFWESQHAIDHKLEKGRLWLFPDPDPNTREWHDTLEDAYKAGERWIRLQGFQFLRENQ